MSGKSIKRFLFECGLNWQAGPSAVLTAAGIKSRIRVGTAVQFGGEGTEWAPEHLFLSSVSGSFLETLLAFAKKNQLKISGFNCNCIGQVELAGSKYKFTRIDVYPEILIPDEKLRLKTAVILKKTHKNCLVTNSINADIYYHSEIFTNPLK
ncbi:MAG: OsmC family protein [Ferruginibacter sp.]